MSVPGYPKQFVQAFSVVFNVSCPLILSEGPVVGKPQGFKYSIVEVDETDVYISSSDDAGGAIYSIPKTGGPLKNLAFTGLVKTFGIDGKNAYWTEKEYEGVSIKKVSKKGGEAVLLMSILTMPKFMAVDAGDDGHVWLTTDTALYAIPKSGDKAEIKARGDNLLGVATDSGYVYYSEGKSGQLGIGKIIKLSKAGESKTDLITGVSAGYIHADDKNVYWVEQTSRWTFAIKSVPKAGGTVITLASGITKPVTGISSDSTHVYWIEKKVDKGSEWEIKRVKRGVVETIETVNNVPSNVAVDEKYVYWAEASDALKKSTKTPCQE